MTQLKTPPKPPLNLLDEIDFLPEWLLDELQDPLSTMSPGQAVRLGTALATLGTLLVEQAKTATFGRNDHHDQGVVFTTVEATSYPAIKNDEIKKRYPQSEHPHLYRKQHRKAHVTTELPFDTKNLLQAA